MTQYNSLNVKLSNSHLEKLKSAIENETEVVLRLSSNMVGDDETNFPHKLLLTNRQVANLPKTIANYLSTDIKLSKTQIHKIVLGSGTTTLIISNDEMKDIIGIIKSLEDSGLLLKGVSETIQNEAKEQKGRFLSVLLGTLGASLLGNILAGKGINRAVEGGIRPDYGNKR